MGTENFRYKRRLRQGDIVIVPSPFNDRSGKKRRPVIVLSNEKYNKILQDFVCIPLSTELRNYDHVFRLYLDDIESGVIHEQSDIRVDKIISIDQRLLYIIIKIKKILQELIK